MLTKSLKTETGGVKSSAAIAYTDEEALLRQEIEELSDECCSKMSLFYAEATPMLKLISRYATQCHMVAAPVAFATQICTLLVPTNLLEELGFVYGSMEVTFTPEPACLLWYESFSFCTGTPRVNIPIVEARKLYFICIHVSLVAYRASLLLYTMRRLESTRRQSVIEKSLGFAHLKIYAHE
ncbi:hypothetical protein Aperf_G00000131557 [Anoplocephala perfoliata]